MSNYNDLLTSTNTVKQKAKQNKPRFSLFSFFKRDLHKSDISQNQAIMHPHASIITTSIAPTEFPKQTVAMASSAVSVRSMTKIPTLKPTPSNGLYLADDVKTAPHHAPVQQQPVINEPKGFFARALTRVKSWFSGLMPRIAPVAAGTLLAVSTATAPMISHADGYKAPGQTRIATTTREDSRFGGNDNRTDGPDGLLGIRGPNDDDSRDDEKKKTKTTTTANQQNSTTHQIMAGLNKASKTVANPQTVINPGNNIKSTLSQMYEAFGNFLVEVSNAGPQRVLDKEMLTKGYRVDPDSGALIIPENKYIKQGNRYISVPEYVPASLYHANTDKNALIKNPALVADYAINSVESSKQLQNERMVSQTVGWGTLARHTSLSMHLI